MALETRERDSGNQLIESYSEAVIDHLRNGKVWATRGRYKGRVVFIAADDLVLPDKPEFDGFFDPQDYLDTKIATTTG